MPAVRKILGMRTISETSALVFGHLPVILSMRVYLHIQPTFPYPVWNPTTSRFCVARFFSQKFEG